MNSPRLNSSHVTRHLSLIVALCATMLCGCHYRSYKEGATSYTSIGVGTAQTVAPFTLRAGKEGDPSWRELSSKGLTNDNTAALEAAVSAAVRAASGK